LLYFVPDFRFVLCIAYSSKKVVSVFVRFSCILQVVTINLENLYRNTGLQRWNKPSRLRGGQVECTHSSSSEITVFLITERGISGILK
jgi:hypothetical protein